MVRVGKLRSAPPGALRTALRCCAALMALWLVAACDAVPGGPDAPGAPPPASPAAPPPGQSTGVSAQSEALSAYYRRVQASQLSYGLLRTDGGGVDTPFTAAMLLRNFEQVAFRDEVASNQSRGAPQPLRRWQSPIRLRVYQSESRPAAEATEDFSSIRAYAARLGRITSHPISITTGPAANFHVFLTTEDDRLATIARIREIEPGTTDFFASFLRDMSRNTHCVVIVYGEPAAPNVIRSAVVLIRAELPSLIRRSCIHEEIAQGLGILNDSPNARPSIFNDDDEFALLTTHDEALLRLLYDRRVRPGMSFDEVARTVSDQAEALASPGPGAS